MFKRPISIHSLKSMFPKTLNPETLKPQILKSMFCLGFAVWDWEDDALGR